MAGFKTVGEFADSRGLLPHEVSNVIARSRVLRNSIPIVAGRRVIGPEVVPVLEMELRRAGKLLPAEAGGRDAR